MSPIPAAMTRLIPAFMAVLLLVQTVRQSGNHEWPPELPAPLRQQLAAAQAHAARGRSLALAWAFAAAMVTLPLGTTWSGLAFGVVGSAALLIAERRNPIVVGERYTASLTPRHVRDYLPRLSTALAALGLAVLVLLFYLGVPTGATQAYLTSDGSLRSEPWMLRPGTYLLGTSTTPSGELLTQPFYPWPGSGMLLPVLGGTALVLCMCLLGLYLAATREQISSVSEHWIDTSVRRNCAESFVGFFLVTLTLPMSTFGETMVEAATWEVAGWDYGRGTAGGLAVVVAMACAIVGALLLLRHPSTDEPKGYAPTTLANSTLAPGTEEAQP